MHILLTGAAGFIGSVAAQQLLAGGHQVTGLDNLNDAYDVRLKHWRLRQLQGRPGFGFHQADITDRAALGAVWDGGADPFEAVINLAARAGVRQSVADPWVYYDANVTGTLNLLEQCRRHGPGKFVLASTSSLYGGHNPMPYQEDADTNRPLSPYAASKKAAEALCYTYHYLHGVDVTVVRYFTVYGPAGRPDMSLFRFVQRVSEGRPITLYGDGSQSRDFTYVDDIARGTIAALRPVGYQVINLGSDKPVVLNDALRLVEQLTGRQAIVERQPAHPADVPATWANITRAGQVLGWEPRVSFESGVRALVEWYGRERNWASELITGV
ncbi:MAG: GDP-mannose 4,6-dehydratase [Anaerolineales bacterium]|nr:GDP-mannose 4,6-dehydratase [Anaerolineales bacterium]